MRIVDAGGKDLPERCVGEVVFSGPSVAAGYWDRPDLTAETKDEDHTTLAAAVRRRVQEAHYLNVEDVLLIGPGELPKTSSGKLQRGLTRQQYLDGALGGEGVRTHGSRGEILTLARHLGKSMIARVKHNIRSSGARFGARKGQ